MSLRVWLPLTKDLRNQGLDDIPSFQLISGNSFITGGKIGEKAFNITKQQRILSNTSCMTGKKQMSYAYWVKVNTVWTTQWLDGIAWYSTDGTSASYSRQEFYNNCTKVGTWFKGSPNSLSGYDFNPEEWTHIAATFNYNTGEVKFYLNGELKGTSNSLSTSDYCRGDFYIGDTGLDILENDVRIYDHALSPLEVKHIAQGLILHYPLNRGGWGQENLLKNSKLDGSWEYPSTSYKDQYAPITASVPTGSAYTLSFDAKSTVNGDKIRTHYYSPNTTTTCTSSQGIIKNAVDGSMDFTLSTQWKRYWVVYNQNETSAVKHVICPRMVSGQGTGVVSVKNVKLEEGSIATSWCPNSSDALATTMGLNDNVEYDVSGYCNNGTRTGTFSWTSDTPKYNVSTNILNGSYIDTGYKENIGTGDFTVSVWIKMPQTSGKSYQPIFSNKTTGATSVGFAIYFNQNQNKLLWSTADGSAATEIWMANTINIYDKWMHIVMIRNASDAKKGYFYINGERYELASVPVIRNITNETYNIQVGDIATHNNSAYRYVGLMSDFRIYATALSVEDIKDLYNLGASIDSNNNLLTYELNEE